RGEKDNENITMLKEHHFRTQEFIFESLNDNFLKRARASRKSRDRMVEKALLGKEKDWTEQDDGVVTWRHRVYVPKNKRLREDIIREHHDSIAAGHLGRYKTQELITRDYWWPYIQADVRKYVDGCETCQRTKVHRGKLHAPLHPNKIPKYPWEHISIDIIGELPESQGYNAILVICDILTKMVVILPTHTGVTAQGVARIFRDHVWSKYGVPRKVISDRGPQFAAQFMRDLYRLVGTQGNLSTVYHPQTDGQTERVNQEVEQYLWVFINHRQMDWAEWLKCAEFSFNDKVHSSTGFSPFYVNYGRHPYKGTNPRREVKSQSAKEFAEQMEKIREETESALKRSQETMKKNYNKKKSQAREYRAGDKVWLEGTNIRMGRPIGKLNDKRQGPFEVIKKEGKSAYRLRLPTTWKKIHPVFNESLLTPFVPASFPSQGKQDPPPPIIVEGEEEYEVEELMDSKVVHGKIKYLVKWKGYPDKADWTWEPEEKILEDNRKEFHEKHSGAPRRIHAVLPFWEINHLQMSKQAWTRGKVSPEPSEKELDNVGGRETITP